MTKVVFDQIIQIRASGEVNMCDCRAVQHIAFQQDMFDLVCYIEEYPSRYVHFIVYGKEPVS